jgi:hypothetical protein
MNETHFVCADNDSLLDENTNNTNKNMALSWTLIMGKEVNAVVSGQNRTVNTHKGSPW